MSDALDIEPAPEIDDTPCDCSIECACAPNRKDAS